MFHNCGFRGNLVIIQGATHTKTIRRFNWGAEVEVEAGTLQTDASSGYNWYHMERKKACVSCECTNSLLAYTFEKNVEDRPRKTRKLIFTPYFESFFSSPQHLSISCTLTSKAHPCSLTCRPKTKHFYNERVHLSTFWGVKM